MFVLIFRMFFWTCFLFLVCRLGLVVVMTMFRSGSGGVYVLFLFFELTNLTCSRSVFMLSCRKMISYRWCHMYDTMYMISCMISCSKDDVIYMVSCSKDDIIYMISCMISYTWYHVRKMMSYTWYHVPKMISYTWYHIHDIMFQRRQNIILLNSQKKIKKCFSEKSKSIIQYWNLFSNIEYFCFLAI